MLTHDQSKYVTIDRVLPIEFNGESYKVSFKILYRTETTHIEITIDKEHSKKIIFIPYKEYDYLYNLRNPQLDLNRCKVIGTNVFLEENYAHELFKYVLDRYEKQLNEEDAIKNELSKLNIIN